MTQSMEWEYKVELVDPYLLDWRASQGWELVSLAPRVKPVIGGMRGGDVVAVLKRPRLGPFRSRAEGRGWREEL
jgi:hypothetical protein